MSEKQDTAGIRFSQVLAGALAAITAAVLGSTMGVAGTVIGAGLASVISTVGGALYLRSIQRTGQGVRSVRDKVVARAGTTRVTLLDEQPRPEAQEGDADAGDGERPPQERRLRWPALVAASVLAFAIGMLVITGVEWLRGEPLSGGEGTTIGRIVRDGPGDADRDGTAPGTGESTAPDTGTVTVTVTPTPSTSADTTPADPPDDSGEPGTTTPDTTEDATPSGSVPEPAVGQSG